MQHCLCLTPVPCLAPAFSVLRFIWTSIQNVKISRWQVKALAQSIAQLLQMIQEEYLAGRLQEINTSTALANLCGCILATPIVGVSGTDQHLSHRLLDEISEFVQKEASHVFLKLLFTRMSAFLGSRDTTGALALLLHLFRQVNIIKFATNSNDQKQISMLINIHAFQKRNDDTLAANQQWLNEQLTQLEMNQLQVMETLGM